MVQVSPERAEDLGWRCRSANEYLLRKVGELGQADPEYPAPVAQGILLLRLDRAREAAQVLAAYTEAHPDGPYAARARNALRSAHRELEQVLTE